MKYFIILIALISVSLNAQVANKKKIKTTYKIALKYDPVCKMEVPKSMKDTVHYQNKIYGVCSSHCKNEIKKSPKKYIK